MCIDASCAESTARSWHEWRGFTNCLPGCGHLSAWWGVRGVHHSSRPSTHAFIRRGIRAEFCDKNMPAVSDLVKDADDACAFRAGYERQTSCSVRYFLIVKLNLSTSWYHVVMSLLWVKNLDTCQIVILLLDYFTKTFITLHACSLDIVQLYNCVIASCVLSACLINEYKTIQCNLRNNF